MTTDLIFQRNMFGLTVILNNGDEKHTVGIFEDSSLDNRYRKVLRGDTWWFRNPKCTLDNLKLTLQGLNSLSGNYTLTLSPNENADHFYTMLKFGDQIDVQTWAFSGVSLWQKWGPDLETQHQKSNRKSAVKLSKDGKSIKVKVDITTMDDDPD